MSNQSLKSRRGITSRLDDFIYAAACLIIGPILFFIGWAAYDLLNMDIMNLRYAPETWIMTLWGGIKNITLLAGAATCVYAVLFLIGVRLLMKIAGYLKRIESLLSAAVFTDEKDH